MEGGGIDGSGAQQKQPPLKIRKPWCATRWRNSSGFDHFDPARLVLPSSTIADDFKQDLIFLVTYLIVPLLFS